MNRKTDVIVIGSGLAGLMAAYAAAQKGAKVKVVSEGMGNLSISPGCIDVLGYDAQGSLIADPWPVIAQLAPEHPYSLAGMDTIRESLDKLAAALGEKGCTLAVSTDEQGKQTNILLPTIMGTLKPTWLAPAGIDAKTIANAQKILIISVAGFRDCRPMFIASQLARYPGWEDKQFQTLVLPAPFDEQGRSINALDLAHLADRDEGRDWLMNRLKGAGKQYDLALLPPMLGALPNSRIRSSFAANIGCPAVEMLSVPPGVGGLRIRKALVDILREHEVEFYENARAISSTKSGTSCESVEIYSTGRNTRQEADAFVIATGGIIGGGLLLQQGKATEAVLGLDIPVPENVDDWSQPKIFGQHLVSRLGVSADSTLRVPDFDNVFFAGRILGGYDWASEKSGHGVACATGWKAGTLAAERSLGGSK